MGRKSAEPKLMLTGGAKPKVQKAGARNWTKEKEQAFLSALAETCKVTAASAAAGVSAAGAYLRRRSNAAFRAGWLSAVGTAYQRLELVLLDRAFNGTEKVIQRRDGSEERMREYSNQLGMQLLKMHRDTAAEANAEMPSEDIEEMRERLVAKLLRLKKLIEAETVEA